MRHSLLHLLPLGFDVTANDCRSIGGISAVLKWLTRVVPKSMFRDRGCPFRVCPFLWHSLHLWPAGSTAGKHIPGGGLRGRDGSPADI